MRKRHLTRKFSSSVIAPQVGNEAEVRLRWAAAPSHCGVRRIAFFYDGIPTAAVTASSIDAAAGFSGGAISTVASLRIRRHKKAAVARAAVAMRSLRRDMARMYPVWGLPALLFYAG
jgi:hypothetical protein